MARQPKPWYRKDRKVWCVTISGKRHSLGASRKEAFVLFRELLRSPEPRQKVVASLSLSEVIDEFLDWVSRNRASATYEWYRCRLQHFFDAHPELTVSQLRPYHVEKWAGNPYRSITTRRNQIRAVKRCLGWAVSQGHLVSSPIEHMEVPSATSREVSIPPEEFDRMMRFVPNGSGFGDLIRITYETGCRPQELIRVEARHFEEDRCRWVFPKTESKGKLMPRTIYLSDYALELSRKLSDRHPSGPLFRNSNDKAWTKDSVGCGFDRLQVRMGLVVMKRDGQTPSPKAIAKLAQTLPKHRMMRGHRIDKSERDLLVEAKRKLTQRTARQLAPRYSLYALRHAWATNALLRGVDALTVAILMGHKDPSTLARTYQHLSHNPEHLLAQARVAITDAGA